MGGVPIVFSMMPVDPNCAKDSGVKEDERNPPRMI